MMLDLDLIVVVLTQWSEPLQTLCYVMLWSTQF